ncbi:MAG: MFS transporter [Microbacteriaceae bacterium]|nr:MFS transporter [Microbacteriaceae bacterium]
MTKQRLLQFRVLSALIISQCAGGVRLIAMPLLVYGGTGSLTYAAIVAIAAAVPAILVGIFGAPSVEQLSRKNIILVANIVRAVLLLLLPLSWDHFGVAAIAAISFITASLGALEQPAMYASLPSLFGENYQDFAGKRIGLSFLMQAISPVIGGFLVAFIGAAQTIFVCGFAYILYAFLIVSIRRFDADYKERKERNKDRKKLEMLGEAIGLVKSVPQLRRLFIFWFFSMIAVPLGVLPAVPYITSTLKMEEMYFGIASACYGTATVVSSILAGKAKFRGGVRIWLLAAGLLYGGANIAMGLQPNFLWFCVLWVIWGIAYGPEEVAGHMVFVKTAPEEAQGRLFALMSVVMTAGTLIGDALVGPISDHFGPQNAMVLSGVIFCCATLFSFGFGKGARAIGEVSFK